MKDFMNSINLRIVYLDLDPDTLIEHLLPPPELHFLNGFVSLLDSILLDACGGFDDQRGIRVEDGIETTQTKY